MTFRPWLEENGYLALQFFVPPEPEEIRKYARGTTFTIPDHGDEYSTWSREASQDRLHTTMQKEMH
jgi:hypothetical protein